MARLSRTVRHLVASVWRAMPWLLSGSLLLATSASGQLDGVRRLAAVLCAVAAVAAALLLEPTRRHHPSQRVTLATYLVVIAAATYLASVLVVMRANTFYSASLLTEGTLLLFVLHAAQAGMRRISPPPTTAAPRAADAFVDGVRVLLIGIFVTTAVSWRPVASLFLILALGFEAIAIIFRTPGALARMVRQER